MANNSPPANRWIVAPEEMEADIVKIAAAGSPNQGKLRFTNVVKDYHKDGKDYACMAINYFMSDSAIGPEHTVTILGNTELKRPAYELWTSPSDQFFLKDGLLRLKCIFGGNPTPDVSWERLNGTFPDRAKFQSFGQELQITNLQLSDAGQYQCMGQNTVFETARRATKVFTIRIESAPYWIEEPKDVEASINETAVFTCLAGGEPNPSYIWYINGIPYEESTDPRIKNNPRFQQPNDNTFILKNLTLEDYMSIQCNATNKHDYVFADVFLNVLEIKTDAN